MSPDRVQSAFLPAHIATTMRFDRAIQRCFRPTKPVPDCAARVSSAQYGDDSSDAQIGQLIRVRGVVGRQVDREPGVDSRSD